MAAVDIRMGPIRRGTTPTAPKPINLPSQKLENQGLVPDVDIVPRGTFCWGQAGRSSAASGKNNEKTDSAALHLDSHGILDNGTNVQNDIDSPVEIQELSQLSNPLHAIESSISSTSTPACITPVETTTAPYSIEANVAISPSSSNAGSLPGSFAPTSASESSTSPSAASVAFNKTWDGAANVEEQKLSKESPVVFCEGSENVPNPEFKQGIHCGDDSLQGSQDFGYFEAFYSNNQAFLSPGMSYSNGPGMTFGPGVHPDSSQHEGFYSFLGVPYYDSTKDKEIVVITMVGNPGFHGNYPPYPGLPDQYGRLTMCGNVPLQFGHFEHFAMPGQNVLDGRHCMPAQNFLDGRHCMSAEIHPMGSGEQDEFVCYEQGWLNGSSAGDLQRGNGAYFPTQFSMCKSRRDHNIPKRAGRQKSAFQNKRAAAKEASSLKHERRVTLLTKDSQHEVVINSLQKSSKPVRNGQAAGFPSEPSFSENFRETPHCDIQCEYAIAEYSNVDTVHEIVDIEKSCVSEVSRGLSPQEMIPQEVTCTGSDKVESTLSANLDISGLKSKVETSVSESSSLTISKVASLAHVEMVVCHQDKVATSCPEAACQVPGPPGMKIAATIVKNTRPNFESNHASFNVDGYSMKAAELPQDALPYVSIKSAALTDEVNEHVNREELLNTSAVVMPSHEHNQGSMLRSPNQKSNREWRRKGSVTVATLGQVNFNSRAQEDVVNKAPSSLTTQSDEANASAKSLQDATIGTKAVSKDNVTSSSCLLATLSVGEGFEDSEERLDASYAANCAALDSTSKVVKRKNAHKAISGNVDLDSVADLSSDPILESSNKIAAKTPPVEGRSKNLKRASCGFGKEWRPKLPGAGHGKSTTKAYSCQDRMAATTVDFSELQESKLCLTVIHGDAKHWLKVTCDGEGVEKVKQLQKDGGPHTLSPVVNSQQTNKNMPLTCVTGYGFNNSTEKELKVGCNSSETCPLKGSRIGDQKLKQQEPQVSNSEESNSTCTGNKPMNDDSYEACSGRSDSTCNHLEVDHKVSKGAKPGLTQGSLSAVSLPTQEKSIERDNSLCPSQKTVGQCMLATQINKRKGLTGEVNDSSKAAHGLDQQSAVKKYQEKTQLPVRNVPQSHAGPLHIVAKNCHAGLMVRSLPNLGGETVKQGLNVASLGGRKRGFPGFYRNPGHPHERQPVHGWQQQKVWNRKFMGVQELQMASTTSSKPHEGCCTSSNGKPGADNKQHISFVQGASCVLWKPKQGSALQVSKEKCKVSCKNHPSSSALQKERVLGECILSGSPTNAPLSSPCGNEQQLKKQASSKLPLQMKETSEVCPANSVPQSPSFGSGQQVDGTVKQEFMVSAFQPRKAFDQASGVISSSSGDHMSDVDEKESLRPASQMKTEWEEHPIVVSSSCATSSPPLGKGQQTRSTGKQLNEAVLEMERSTVIEKETSSVEWVARGPISQPVSAVAVSSKLEDNPLARHVRPHSNRTSWRPKMVSGNIAVKSTFSNEVNENDPTPPTNVEGALKEHTNTLPASKFAASNDLHVWKNNGRHTVRASYGLPYRRKDGASSLELLDRANDTCLDQESPRALKSSPVSKEMKLAGSMKQRKTSLCWEHPVSKLKFSQHHGHAVKQAHFTSNQHSIGVNRRPFSTNSNYPHYEQIVHHQQPLLHMCLPMEQGYRRPFSAKSNLSYHDSMRAVQHQLSPSCASKHTERIKVRENLYTRGTGHVDSLDLTRSDIKPARHVQLHTGRKFVDSDKRGWVVKTVTRCGEC